MRYTIDTQDIYDEGRPLRDTDIVDRLNEQDEDIERLRTESKELLDALERLVHLAECNTSPGPNTLTQARAAIAKVGQR